MKDLSHFRPIYIMSPGKIAGAEKVVLTGLVALKNLGLNPLMILIREERAPLLTEEFILALDPSIEYRIVKSTKAIDWDLIREIKKILKELQSTPYIIHTHGFKALVTTKLTFSSKPHFHTHHGNTGHTFKVKCYEALAFFVMRFCTHVIAVSKQMEGLLFKELYPMKRISTIDNMLSFHNAAEIANSRAQRPLNLEMIQLIYIGRISPEKGLSDFILAWAKAKNKNSFHLTILGDGPDKIQCQRLVQSLGLNDHCHFQGFTKDPASFLSQSDLLIMPSHTEGLPMTLIEAACSGLPVLANEVGAISQVVHNNVNGHLISRESSSDEILKQWIHSLEVMKDHLPAWQSAAQKEAAFFQKYFSPKAWATKTKELYLQYL